MSEPRPRRPLAPLAGLSLLAALGVGAYLDSRFAWSGPALATLARLLDEPSTVGRIRLPSQVALARAHEISDKEGLVYVSGFDDPWIIAGQGTIGLELLEQCAGLDCVIVPVGGGGLIARAADAGASPSSASLPVRLALLEEGARALVEVLAQVAGQQEVLQAAG